MPKLRHGSKWGFEPGLSRLRVRHSTTELLRSTLKIEITLKYDTDNHRLFNAMVDQSVANDDEIIVMAPGISKYIKIITSNI